MPITVLLARTLASLVFGAASFSALAAIDINKASANQLQSLKGIGPQLSARILEARQKAAFRNWDDLIERVDGLGQTKAARLSAGGLTVAGSAFAATDSMLSAVAPARKAPAVPPTLAATKPGPATTADAATGTAARTAVAPSRPAPTPSPAAASSTVRATISPAPQPAAARTSAMPTPR